MNLLLFLIIISALFLSDFKKVFLTAFLFGVLNDLIFGNLVGFTSLIFLLFCFLAYLYRKRFSSSHFLFQLSFIIMADSLFILLKGEVWSFKKALFLAFISLIVFLFINRIKGKASGLELEI